VAKQAVVAPDTTDRRSTAPKPEHKSSDSSINGAKAPSLVSEDSDASVDSKDLVIVEEGSPQHNSYASGTRGGRKRHHDEMNGKSEVTINLKFVF